MSNEALTEQQEEEMVNVMSLLANQSEETTTEDVDPDEQGGDAPETLEAALALLTKKNEIIGKRNKSNKKAKDAVHRANDERDAALKQLATRDDGGDGRSESEAERLEQETQDWKDRFAEDPNSIFDYFNHMQSVQSGQIAGYLQDQFRSVDDRFEGLKRSTNPERIELAQQMEVLRNSEETSGLSEDAIFAVAKLLTKTKVKQSQLRGSITGKRVQQNKKPAPNFGGLSREEVRQKLGFKPRG